MQRISERAALGGLALVTQVVRQLAEGDHADEDEARHEHREHDTATFGRGIRDERERGEHERDSSRRR